MNDDRYLLKKKVIRFYFIFVFSSSNRDNLIGNAKLWNRQNMKFLGKVRKKIFWTKFEGINKNFPLLDWDSLKICA